VRIQMMRAVGAILLLAIAASIAASQPPPLRVVSRVDLEKYSGKWYEIARLPNNFQSRCGSDVVAHYTTRSDGRLNVINQCRKPDGQIVQARGILRKAGDQKNNAALQVRFAPAILSFLPNVWGDYWIIGIGPDYTWSVVGVPDRRYLWILSRTPSMSASSYEQALEIGKGNGFDTSALVKTPQRIEERRTRN
jgi:apolipoprotein D and lipocalin family protein